MPSAAEVLNAAGAIVGPDHVERDAWVEDQSGTGGEVPVLARPGTAAEVAELVAWAYSHDVQILPVGGATGFSGGITPTFTTAGIAIALERLTRIRSFDPLLWRMEVEAGVTTATVHRLARENGLLFPPDPGAPESSQIGGNLATNAGGPHTFKYGVTSRWVTGVEAVVAPGELGYFGGPLRKDVASYDLRGLLIGSEGTLGIITAAWLRLTPAPPAGIPLLATYRSIDEGVDAVYAALASNVVPAVIEFFHGSCLRHVPPVFADASETEFMVLCEAESEDERAALAEALGDTARTYPREEVWRWRSGMIIGVRAVRGEVMGEDIGVPLDRIGEAIEETVKIGERVGLEVTSWGHIGDGNLHPTFLYDPHDDGDVRRAQQAAVEVFDLARRLGGTVSAEHGIGLVKGGQLDGQCSPAALAGHQAIKRALDPKGLFNPGKKLAIPAAPQRPRARG